MSLHPLIALANDREVKQAKGFREAAARLTGEGLSTLYHEEVASAPKRHDVGKKYLGVHPRKAPGERKPSRDAEHLALALISHARDARSSHGEAEGRGGQVAFPDGGSLCFVDYHGPLATGQPDRDKGDQDPNKGLGKADLLGLTHDDRLSISQLKFVAPDSTRTGSGDTPLRALLEGLAYCAILEANRAALQSEMQLELGGDELKISEDPPQLILLGTPRYWQLCRKREAQKGAGWIRELQRLGAEIGQHIGVEVLFLGLDLSGDPGWEYAEGFPVLRAAPRLAPAWERSAGKLKPKPRPKPLSADDIVIDADLTRPIRAYVITQSYEAGDRIEHKTLGAGVVQGGAGQGKIHVIFGEKKSLLIHERPAPAS